ncbi:hypothetical protein NX773_10440 [Massilia solisilvae]|uniref:YihY/virulence factor BrkB family protein n=1 Tax=Massilia solisilvae TaxID=1811225 RepID=A0ABT2BKH9_9BURK|nr:hypothetical protein [Massilia solisilvae]MCS0608580.1 hypothetical protein [Massilia solisilvae]
MNTAIQSAPTAAAPVAGYRAATAVRAARSALQWRLLAWWAGLLLVPAAVSTLPVWQLLSAALDHSVHASELAAGLDLTVIEDLMTANSRAGTGIGNGNLLALLLTLLLSPLLSGMAMHAARAPQQPGFGALLAGGVQEYMRLLRMLVWAVVPLALMGGLAGIAFTAAKKYGESAILESSANHAQMTAIAVAALLFALADASLDAGRAVLASDRRRRSAVKAWWQGLKLLLRRPLATLGSYLGITVAGLALAALLAIARLNVPPLGIGGFIGAFVLTQLAVVAIAWMRCARLFAMLELVRDKRG